MQPKDSLLSIGLPHNPDISLFLRIFDVALHPRGHLNDVRETVLAFLIPKPGMSAMGSSSPFIDLLHTRNCGIFIASSPSSLRDLAWEANTRAYLHISIFSLYSALGRPLSSDTCYSFFCIFRFPLFFYEALLAKAIPFRSGFNYLIQLEKAYPLWHSYPSSCSGSNIEISSPQFVHLIVDYLSTSCSLRPKL